MMFDETNNNQTVKVKAGQTFQIILPSKSHGGYLWKSLAVIQALEGRIDLDSDLKTGLTISEPIFRMPGNEGKSKEELRYCGAGIDIFECCGTVGKFRLMFECKRPFEPKETPPIEMFQLFVTCEE